MRRAAVLEELGVELHVLIQALLLRLCAELLITVLALRAGGDLHAAPDQVIALRHAVLVAHVVERALLRAVIGHEEELVAVLLLHPVERQVLGLGGQVALLLLRHLVAELLLEFRVQVGQLDLRERQRRDLQRHAEDLLQLLAIGLLHLAQRVGQQLGLQRHHVLIALDEAELQVKAGELGGVLAGEALLRAEDRADLEDALKAGGHGHLLVELRALCKVGVAVEVLDLEHVRAGLGGRADQLRRVDLQEVSAQQILAHRAHKHGLDLEEQLILFGAQVDPAVVDALVDGRALVALARLAVDGQRRGDALDDDLPGIDLHAAQLHILAFDSLADDGDDGVGGQGIDRSVKLRILVLLHGHLHLAGNILEHDEGHLALIADGVHKAADLDLLGAAHIGRIRSFHRCSLHNQAGRIPPNHY